jgi:hypothetical protein
MGLAEAEEVDEGAVVGVGGKVHRFLDPAQERIERHRHERARTPGASIVAAIRVVVHGVTCYNRRATLRPPPRARLRVDQGLLSGFTMSTTGVQPELFRLLRMLIEPILDEVFPNETGAARLQQVGLFAMIYMLQGDEQPVTESRLATMTGHQQSEVNRQIRKLLAVDVIERTAITSPHGRGRAWHLSIKHSPKTEKLAQLLLEAGKASAKKPKG